ncbi:hypothetical protein acdb102_33010 [Acidothermaceae bacterium B102]|nr:hypothetical protein acdb102_33010 [Acidothermaceae bacterium B102]
MVFDDTDGGLLPVSEVLLQVAALAPGGEAISLLQGLVGRPMTEVEQLRTVALWQPQLGWVVGAEQTALLGYTGATPAPDDTLRDLDDDFIPVSLSRVLNCTVDHAADRMFRARQLTEGYRDLGDLLRAGALDPYRVRLITEVLNTLQHPDQVAAVQAEILPIAATLAPSKLRKTLRRLAREVDEAWNTAMFVKAAKTRRVTFDPAGDDGLVGVHAYLPPVEAIALQEHLEQAARQPVDPDDGRCHDERMADALLAAVLGSTPGDPTTPLAPDVLVNVFVPAPLLLGLGGDLDGIGELDGYGALPADLVRALAADAQWRRWVLEPVTGHLLDLGKHRYRPSEELAEYVRARDRYCRWPGSTRSAKRADLDHVVAFQQDKTGPDDDRGGNTSSANLAALSRRVHRAKTHGTISLTITADGTVTWTTPDGHTYTTKPHNYFDGL